MLLVILIVEGKWKGKKVLNTWELVFKCLVQLPVPALIFEKAAHRIGEGSAPKPIWLHYQSLSDNHHSPDNTEIGRGREGGEGGWWVPQKSEVRINL